MAVEFFLKLEGIEGEASGAWAKQIQITSFGFNTMVPSDSVSGSATGKARYSDITLAKQADSASARLLNAISQNMKIPTAKISAIKAGAAGGQPYLTVELANARITSWNFAANTEVPGETFTLAYRKITFSYYAQTGQGLLTQTSTTTVELDTPR